MDDRRLFIARLLPIDKTAHIREPGVGIADVKISRTALDAQRPVVGHVPVLLAHDDKRVVGRVLGLAPAAGWWTATLDIDPGANDVVRIGTAVSVGLDLEETSKANQWTSIERVASATLKEVSLCRQGMVAGAEIISVLRSRKASDTRSGTSVGTAQLYRRLEPYYHDLIVEPAPDAARFIEGLLLQGYERVT